MFHCSFKKSEVDREKEVITREIEKTQSNIQRQFYYLSQENTYLDHPSQFPVIGFLDKFNTITKKDLETFYKRNYVPSNMMLIIGGPISINDVKKTVETTFGIEKKVAKPIFTNRSEPMPFNARELKKEIDMNSTLISLRFPTVDLYSEDLYPLDLLDYILGNGNQSILTKKLVEELLNDLINDEHFDTIESEINKICSSMACHGSIRSGRVMQVEEMNDLLRKIEKTKFSGQCNHGRPTYVELDLNEIEKLFGRK